VGRFINAIPVQSQQKQNIYQQNDVVHNLDNKKAST